MADEANEYERLRQENILKNQALLRQLQLDPASLGATRKTNSNSTSAPGSSKKRAPKKEPGIPLPRRTSSRLAGLPADSERAKRKADEDDAALLAAENANRAKRARVPGDLSFELNRNLLDSTRGARFEKSFTDEDVEETTDKSLKSLRESMSGLKLYETFGVNGMDIIYSIVRMATETDSCVCVPPRYQDLPGADLPSRFPPGGRQAVGLCGRQGAQMKSPKPSPHSLAG